MLRAKHERLAAMEKDKVESLPVCWNCTKGPDSFLSIRHEAKDCPTRPSVPAQGQAVEWCNCGDGGCWECWPGNFTGKVVFEGMKKKLLALAASRSGAQPPQLPEVLQMDASGRPVHELLHLAAGYMNQNGGGPLADCLTLKAQEIESLSGDSAPAAGSPERECQNCKEPILTFGHFYDKTSESMVCMRKPALAGTQAAPRKGK